ncbi:MAG: quinone-dependent dihydroorotate dehydrogenase [Pseudomonadota bacterium]
MSYSALRPLLFSLPEEVAHDFSLNSLRFLERAGLGRLAASPVQDAPVEVMGLRFPNPVGLAAGLDKDARYVNALAALGFGFIEVGTVTPVAQPGNPKPRMFRLPKHEALINRMGFNNDGVTSLVQRVQTTRYSGVLGINIGKNKTTPEERALDDYVTCLRAVYPHASYIAVNISSPNTPGLRNLQAEDQLKALLEGLTREHGKLRDEYGQHRPLAVKIAPDMSEETAAATARILLDFAVDGVIVTNTTIARDAVAEDKNGGEAGGLSGQPLRDAADRVLAVVSDTVGQRMAKIGVGGIMSGEDAQRKIRLGADLVQIYTGFIYRGPKLIADAVKSIDGLARNRGEAVQNPASSSTD